MKSSKTFFLVLLGLFLMIPPVFAEKNIFTRRYLWLGFDMLARPGRNAQLYPLADRAADAGYNGILLRGWYHDLDVNPQIQKGKPELVAFKAHCDAKGLALTPVGLYQGEVAIEDSSQAEAFPVKGTKFVVSGGMATAVADPEATIENGGFEEFSGHKPSNWQVMGAAPGVNFFIDEVAKRSGKASIRIEDPKSYTRVSQRVTNLRPFRAYELKIWLKTEDYTDHRKLGFVVRGPTRTLLHRRDVGLARWGAGRNMSGFRPYTIDFNSLECSSAYVDVLITERKATGKVWVDDVSIREVGLYETIRRPSCPVVVRSEDGKTIYSEGKDYAVTTGTVLCNNCSEEPQKLTIPAGSGIVDGQVLRVDWFQHANVETWRATTSFNSFKAWDMTANDIKTTDSLFGTPRSYYVFYDEWRDACWDPVCQATYPNAGEYMGWTIARTTALLQWANNNREVITVNDMYDPYHNALKKYGMTWNGTLNSWKHMPDSLVILNWRPGGRPIDGEDVTLKSMKFFAGLDPKYPGVNCRQILSVTFAPSQAQGWENQLTIGEQQGLTGVIGAAYVTWSGDFTGIEPTAQVFKDAGRWGKGPIPFPPVGIEPQMDLSSGSNLNLGFKQASRTVRFSLPQNGHVRLRVADVLGRTHTIISRRAHKAGQYRVSLEEISLSCGVYFIILDVGELGIARRKIVITQ